MQKRMALCLFLLAFGALVRAQVLVTPQLPPIGLTVKSQLWNLILVNTGNENLDIQLELVLTDVNSGLVVLSGKSRIFPLPPGSKMVRLIDVMPVTYTAGPGGAGLDTSPEGFLPIGVFNACFEITKWLSDAPENIGEECETVEVEPLGPPQLVQPADSDHVDQTRPFFTWLPPTPANLFTDLNYSWQLVEVGALQTGAEAIEENIPVLSYSNLSYNSLQYPMSMPELDSSKTYAWRVTANSGLSPVGNSEVWTFRIQRYAPDTIQHSAMNYYSRLRPVDDGSFVYCKGLLLFEYLNELNNTSVEVHVFDITSSVRTEVALDSNTLQMGVGQRYGQMDLRETAGMQDRHYYLFELINVRGEHWYLKFQFVKPD